MFCISVLIFAQLSQQGNVGPKWSPSSKPEFPLPNKKKIISAQQTGLYFQEGARVGIFALLGLFLPMDNFALSTGSESDAFVSSEAGHC